MPVFGINQNDISTNTTNLFCSSHCSWHLIFKGENGNKEEQGNWQSQFTLEKGTSVLQKCPKRRQQSSSSCLKPRHGGQAACAGLISPSIPYDLPRFGCMTLTGQGQSESTRHLRKPRQKTCNTFAWQGLLPRNIICFNIPVPVLPEKSCTPRC